MRLAGARVVVTGASRGIGEEFARKAAARGARVVLVARSEDVIAKIAEELGGESFAADLSDAAAIEPLARLIEAAGPVDVLVNNAGLELAGAFVSARPEQLQELVALNLMAPMLLCRLFLPGMLDRGSGHVVNVSSLAATNAIAGLAPYCASKSGLSHFTAGLRMELKRTGVKTTLVEIGPVETGMLDRVYAYGPSERAFRRFGRLQLLPTLDASRITDAMIDAVERDRRHVRLPRRDAVFPMLVEVPRRFMEVMLYDLPGMEEPSLPKPEARGRRGPSGPGAEDASLPKPEARGRRGPSGPGAEDASRPKPEARGRRGPSGPGAEDAHRP